MQEDQPLIYLKTFQCQNHNPASIFCSHPGCLDPALICNDQSCQCYNKRHLGCKSKKVEIKKFIEQKINQKRSKLTVNQEQFYQKMIGICQDLIEKLSQDKVSLMQAMDMPGIGYNGRQFINLINDNRFQIVKGDLINQVSQEVSPKFSLQTFMQNFDKTWAVKSIQFEQIRSYLRFNEKLNFKPKLASVITDIIGQSHIRKFLQRKVKDFELLYRYVQRFGKKDFHNCCDDVSDTLTIIKTKYGKIIGGYTPIPWKSPQTLKYVRDPSRKTFLFSLSLIQKYPLVQPQGYAVIHESGSGPIFGGRNQKNQADLKMKDSNTSLCYSYFPTAYGDSNTSESKKSSQLKFLGQNSHDFSFAEYEVFKVIWK